jgi:hypothetical protein
MYEVKSKESNEVDKGGISVIVKGEGSLINEGRTKDIKEGTWGICM